MKTGCLIFCTILSLVIFSQPTKLYFTTNYSSTSSGKVRSCNVNGSSDADVIAGLNQPRPIAFDHTSTPNRIYYVPYGASKIVRCDYDGSNSTDIVTGTSGIYDIALDLVNNKIYWTRNTGSSNDQFLRADLDGSNLETLWENSSTSTGYRMGGVALDIDNDKIYWVVANTGAGDKIYKSDPDGSNRTTIIDYNDVTMIDPGDIEVYNTKIYWCDNGLSQDKIYSADLDGSNIGELITGIDVELFVIDETNEYLYWADISADKIQRADIDGNNVTDILTGQTDVWGVALDENLTAVPVQLVSFEGRLIDAEILLIWSTITETNNYGFQVQRKKIKDKGEDQWEDIGFVQGHGTTNSPKDYSFTDSDLPDADEVSYRLKQIDNDGIFSYSKVVTVDLSTITEIEDENKKLEFSLAQNYPNPFNPSTTINFSIPENGNVKLTVYNSLGQEVKKLIQKQMSTGQHQVNFNANGLPSGFYTYRIDVDGKFTSTKKMLLIR